MNDLRWLTVKSKLKHPSTDTNLILILKVELDVGREIRILFSLIKQVYR